jgi:hypothetical protein
MPIAMLERHHLLKRPVEVVGEKRHLLIQSLSRIANYPSAALISTSNFDSQ